MRLSLELIVIAIVILVVAVVVLAIFGGTMERNKQLTDIKASCIQMGSASCKSMGELPPTWKIQKLHYGNKMETCEEITGISDCSGFGVT